jgi:hypothetical protein
VLADYPAGHTERLIEGLPSGRVPVWWSPDGRTIGSLIHGQSPDQGMWLVNADGTGRRKLVGAALATGGEHLELDATLVKVWQPRR